MRRKTVECATGSQTTNTSVSSGGGSLSALVRLKGHSRGRKRTWMRNLKTPGFLKSLVGILRVLLGEEKVTNFVPLKRMDKRSS